MREIEGRVLKTEHVPYRGFNLSIRVSEGWPVLVKRIFDPRWHGLASQVKVGDMIKLRVSGVTEDSNIIDHMEVKERFKS